MACAILERTSGLEPSSETNAPRYLKLVTVPNFCPFTFILFVCVCVYVQRLSFIVNYKHYIHFFYRYLAVFFLDLPCWDAYVKANSAEMVGRPLKRSTRPVSAMFEI